MLRRAMLRLASGYMNRLRAASLSEILPWQERAKFSPASFCPLSNWLSCGVDAFGCPIPV